MNDYVQQIQRQGMVNPMTGTISAVPRPTNTRPEAQSGNQLMQEILELKEQLANQKNQFDRFVHIAQTRIGALEREVSSLKGELEKASQLLGKLNDKNVVEKTREALFNHKEKAPVDRPIDRNNVAPKDVQISNIFNMGGKRF